MSTEAEFMREERYYVIKRSDFEKCLTLRPASQKELRKALHSILNACSDVRCLYEKPPLECVVVESDWPEYEPVWAMIEARMTGTEPSPAEVGSPKDLEQIISKALGLYAESYEMMARGTDDARVACYSVATDIRQNFTTSIMRALNQRLAVKEGEARIPDNELCPNCKGSGEAMCVVGRPPDDYWDEIGPCPKCDGEGTLLAAYKNALQQISLAGMTLPLLAYPTEETTREFHARQAWKFIGIAANALSTTKQEEV